jgi:hypothetical protein
MIESYFIQPKCDQFTYKLIKNGRKLVAKTLIFINNIQ